MSRCSFVYRRWIAELFPAAPVGNLVPYHVYGAVLGEGHALTFQEDALSWRRERLIGERAVLPDDPVAGHVAVRTAAQGPPYRACGVWVSCVGRHLPVTHHPPLRDAPNYLPYRLRECHDAHDLLPIGQIMCIIFSSDAWSHQVPNGIFVYIRLECQTQMIKSRILAVLFLAAFLFTPLCRRAWAHDLADLARFPQSALSYINGNADEPITSYENQKIYADEYIRNLLAPWENEDLGYLDLDADKILSFQRGVAKKRLYAADRQPVSKSEMAGIASNADVPFGEANLPGIALTDADVRVLPTAKALYPSADSAAGARGLLRLDSLQNSTIRPGEPLRVLHYSKDTAWVFVATGSVVGWVKASAIAGVNAEFIDRWTYSDYAVVTVDNVKLNDSAVAKMGTVLPREGGWLYLPVRGEFGRATVSKISLPADLWAPFPIAFTPRNAAGAIDRMMGEPYGWGGVSGYRDCSAMTKDYFSLFGIWLPRNSGDQAKTGARIPLSNVAPMERERVIAEKATPFASLIQMPGHIMLYLGVYDSEPVVFHNIWGVRVNGPGGKPARAVVGRAAVTGLRLGSELSDRPRESLLIDRLSTLSFPMAGSW